jgi:hypothetical protein
MAQVSPEPNDGAACGAGVSELIDVGAVFGEAPDVRHAGLPERVFEFGMHSGLLSDLVVFTDRRMS